MAFDMYAGGTHDSIGHNEEFIFAMAQADESRYPELLAIWNAFYDDPRIPVARAGAIVHELLLLLHANGGLKNKMLAHTVLRLLLFFSTAYQNGQEIRCCSD